MSNLRPADRVESLARHGKAPWKNVPAGWRDLKALASAEIRGLTGPLVSLDEVTVRSDLEVKLASLLYSLGIQHLDIDVIQGARREVTQAIARVLYGQGAAGVLYKSRFDNIPGVAFFEGRFDLKQSPPHDWRSLTASFPELEQVCSEWGLKL